MTTDSIGVAVIGGGMAGRAHAAGYRNAGGVFSTDRRDVRLVAVADVVPAAAEDAARRYGYQRAETDWRAVAEAPDIDAVSVVVANQLHREIVEGLLAAGKHVLCEKPLAPTYQDAEAMAEAADRSGRVAAVGYTFRRLPAAEAVRQLVASGGIGEPVHFNGRYWCDYAIDPRTPLTWRYQGGPGSGALADVGSHLTDLAEFLCGPLAEVSGAALLTAVTERPIPAGRTVGHTLAATTGETGPVGNEDLATFTARFASGAVGTFSVSRVADALPNGLAFELFGTGGSASYDLLHIGEYQLSDRGGSRRVIIGPEHPYLGQGVPMDAGGVSLGQSDLFTFQARAFLDQVAGIDGGLPRCPSFHDGLHGLAVRDAVTESARSGGASVKVR